MKVAIITDTYHPNVNGVVKTITQLEQHFQMQGIDYKLYYPSSTDTSTDYQQPFFATKFILYPEIQWALVPYLVFKAALDTYEPSVLHIVTQGPLGYMATRYAKDRQIPYIAAYTTDFNNYLNFYKLDLLSPLLTKYLVKFHEGAYTNLVPSSYSIHQLEGFGLYNLTHWGRGIELEQFNPAKRDDAYRQTLLEGDDYLLLYCGRLAKEKKLDVLMDMMAQLEAEGEKVRLLLIGDGPYRQELEARQLKQVSFLGFQKGDALHKIYACSDAFVFASENETFGNVILEAFASRLPVVAVAKGGIMDNLKHLHNGLTVTENTGSAFANYVKYLKNNPDLANSLAQNALKDVQSKSWHALFTRLIGLYEDACQQQLTTPERLA